MFPRRSVTELPSIFARLVMILSRFRSPASSWRFVSPSTLLLSLVDPLYKWSGQMARR